MVQAMLSSISSIKAQQTRMDEIGNNLANINTTGYKSGDVQFEDMMSVELTSGTGPGAKVGGTNPQQTGLGVSISGIDVNTQQGTLTATNRNTDLAIQGQGFFMVSDGTNVQYTRDGGFALDGNGDLVSRGTGDHVLGYNADSSGAISTGIAPTAGSKINIPIGGLSSAKGTDNVTMSGNLDGTLPTTGTWSAQIRTYDQQGGAHDLTFVFKNRSTTLGATAPSGATSSWDWDAYEGSATTGTPIGSSSTAGNTQLFFDGSGKSVSALAASAANSVTVPASPGAPAEPIKVDFSSMTQLKSDSSAFGKSQDGIPFGSLSNFAINADGTIVGTFSNGQTRNLAQIAIANFQNPGGLRREGNNLWSSSANSGTAMVGTPSTGGRGSVSAGFLEGSNADMTTELTNLIITQRGYQANTKIITTVDEMMQDLIALKR